MTDIRHPVTRHQASHNTTSATVAMPVLIQASL